MSIVFGRGTKPEGLTAKTFGIIFGKDVLLLGDYEISIKDFFFLAHYVLTNTNLREKDPRLKFVACVKEMKAVPGYNEGGRRAQ